MDINREQLLALNKLTGIKVKRLQTYFRYFNPPYDVNERKAYLYNATKCCSSSADSLKKFTFLLDNIRCRHAKDIIIHNSIRFNEVRPELFTETGD